MLVHLRVYLAVNEVGKNLGKQDSNPAKDKRTLVVYSHPPKPLVRRFNQYMWW